MKTAVPKVPYKGKVTRGSGWGREAVSHTQHE